jgi:peptidoglycan biosynthesis protein MviN/MurJ (putative lipid II flippase)
VVINTVLAYQFATSWGIIGIAVASSISSTLSVLAMMLILKLRYFRKNSYLSWRHLLLFLIASGVMGGLLQPIIAKVTFSHDWWMLTVEIVLVSALGAAIYGAVLFILLRREFLKLLRGLND